MTKNFNIKEFESKDGAIMPVDVRANIEQLAVNLQVLRDYVKAPITITSGYRSPEHNKSIGGAYIIVDGRRVETSQHVKGTAADFKVTGMRPREVFAIISNLIENGKMKEGGLGLYSNWVHYDIRGTKARW